MDFLFIKLHLSYGTIIRSSTPKSYLYILKQIQNGAIRIRAGVTRRERANPLPMSLKILVFQMLVSCANL